MKRVDACEDTQKERQHACPVHNEMSSVWCQPVAPNVCQWKHVCTFVAKLQPCSAAVCKCGSREQAAVLGNRNVAVWTPQEQRVDAVFSWHCTINISTVSFVMCQPARGHKLVSVHDHHHSKQHRIKENTWYLILPFTICAAGENKRKKVWDCSGLPPCLSARQVGIVIFPNVYVAHVLTCNGSKACERKV